MPSLDTQRLVGAYLSHVLSALDAADDLEVVCQLCEGFAASLLGSPDSPPQQPPPASGHCAGGPPAAAAATPAAHTQELLHGHALRAGWPAVRTSFLEHGYQAWASACLSGDLTGSRGRARS